MKRRDRLKSFQGIFRRRLKTGVARRALDTGSQQSESGIPLADENAV